MDTSHQREGAAALMMRHPRLYRLSVGNHPQDAAVNKTQLGPRSDQGNQTEGQVRPAY